MVQAMEVRLALNTLCRVSFRTCPGQSASGPSGKVSAEQRDEVLIVSGAQV